MLGKKLYLVDLKIIISIDLIKHLKILQHQATAKVLGQLLVFLLKLSALGMIIFILYSLIQNDSFANSLPLVALYAFGGYRILPALQQSYNSLSNLRFAGPAL